MSTSKTTMANKEVKRLPYNFKKVNDMVIEASKKVPPKFQPYVRIAAPIIATIGFILSKIEPILVLLYVLFAKVWKLFEPFHPEDLFPAILGLMMCFFGGSYLLLIAAIEAWRASSWEQNKKDLQILWSDMVKVREAHAKDNKEDKDGNGIADVDELDATKLFLRRLNIALISVNPDALSLAFGNLYTAALAIVCTLRIQFARAIALGNSIGDIIAKPASRYISPVIAMTLPKEYKKWANPTVIFVIKFIAINVAWYLQRIISSVHSAIRGGQMFGAGIISYLNKRGLIKFEDKDTYIDETVGFLLAGLGFFFQATFGWQVPFPLNIIFLPFSIMENFLSYYLAKK